MKASTVIAVAAGLTAYTASAQFDQIPQCALTCAISSLSTSGCPATDIACICQATAFVTSLVPCVQGACSAAEFEATVAAASGLCQSAGVTLNIPVPGASSTTAPPSSSTLSVSTSVVSTTETVVEPPVTNTTTTATEDLTPKPTGNGTTTDVSPPTPSGTDGSSASRNAVAFGGLGALVAFVAALL